MKKGLSERQRFFHILDKMPATFSSLLQETLLVAF